jgi:excinuclease ABC subunit C
MDESLLDDCPGVSQARKAALLKAFGSTTRLKAASLEALATIPGISNTLAATIHDFLQTRRSA